MTIHVRADHGVSGEPVPGRGTTSSEFKTVRAARSGAPLNRSLQSGTTQEMVRDGESGCDRFPGFGLVPFRGSNEVQ
jgi:hypothetical protein